VSKDRDGWIVWLITIAILVAMAAGVALWRGNRQTTEARDKAHEFATRLEAAGFKAPDEAAVARLLGSEGGLAAESPWAALRRAEYFAQFATAGPASRPVILDPSFVAAERIYLSVYEPEKLPRFEQAVKGLKLGDTIRDR
jgi:hypothetical protein